MCHLALQQLLVIYFITFFPWYAADCGKMGIKPLKIPVIYYCSVNCAAQLLLLFVYFL